MLLENRIKRFIKVSAAYLKIVAFIIKFEPTGEFDFKSQEINMSWLWYLTGEKESFSSKCLFSGNWLMD